MDCVMDTQIELRIQYKLATELFYIRTSSGVDLNFQMPGVGTSR